MVDFQTSYSHLKKKIQREDHQRITDICLGLARLDLPPYVLLEIINIDLLSWWESEKLLEKFYPHKKRIELIIAFRRSVFRLQKPNLLHQHKLISLSINIWMSSPISPNKNSNKHTLNSYFDQIYLINLARRPDKLTRALAQLNRYQIRPKIITAIDGYHPEIYYQRDPNLPPGAYGYLLSWKNVILDAIQAQFNRILILDDDIILHRKFNQYFDHWIHEVISTQKKNWKVLLLGATQHTTRPNLTDDSINSSSPIKAYYPNVIDGSFAVALDHTLFHEILEELNQKNQYVDSDILRLIYREYPKQCFVASPNLMIADVTSSDIRKQRPQKKLAQKVGWELSNYHWPNSKPLVTLIIPCYQAEKTIARCLTSMLRQTYRPLEIILVEDGSSDQSFEIVSQIFEKWEYSPKAKDLSYQLIRHQNNRGCYAARNTALQNASGDLIGFQDADDISLDYRVEDQVNALLEYGVKFTTCLILRTHLPYLSQDPIQLKKDIDQTRIHYPKHCCRAKVGLATTLFRKEVFQKYGKYPLWKWGADDQYLRHLFPKLDSNYRMMNYLDQNEYIPKLYYRVSKVLYLSHEMTQQNLTQQRLKYERRNKEK